MTRILFSTLCIFAAIAECWVVLHLFRKKQAWPYRRLLSVCLAGSAATSISYTIAINSYVYFIASLFNSIYFCSIDVILLAFVELMVELTGARLSLEQKGVLFANRLYAVFDCLVLLINPFREIAIHYTLLHGAVDFWQFRPGVLYYLHLAFCYLMIVEVMLTLLEKIIRTPALYRGRYSLIAEGLLVIVLLNCAFLYVPGLAGLKFDVSVLLYGVLCFLVYYNSVYYSEHKLLQQAPRAVLTNMAQPVILFDYEKRFVFRNAAARRFFPENRPELTLDEFIHAFEFTDRIQPDVQKTSFQWVYRAQIYRCDYQVMRSKGSSVGYVFTFTEAHTEYDLLTGFHTEVAAQAKYESFSGRMELPLGVLVCDLNRLSYLNEAYGRENGDMAISAAAAVMKRLCPEQTFFVRMHDAILVGICAPASAQQMKKLENDLISAVSEESVCTERLQLQCAFSMCASTDPDDIRQAIAAASNSISIQKMMDGASTHSSLLSSLACAMQEADSETELHVMRTRTMGEKLADRLGLSDEDTANLALLCLLHDIGKLGIPIEILNKPGKLSRQEWELLKSHTEKGYRIAKASRELEPIADMILHHHEYWDGSGYPGGLAREEIPLLSRMIAIIDSYDAMTHDRPYRKAIGVQRAVVELEQGAGKQFDPYIVTEFLKMIREMPEYLQTRMQPVASVPQVLTEQPPEEESVWTDRQAEQPVEAHNPYLAQIQFSRYILRTPDEVIVSADAGFEYLTGYSAEDVATGQMIQSMLIFPEDLDDYNHLKLKLLSRDKEAYMEHRLKMKNGTARVVCCHGVPFFDSALKEQRIEIIIVDITDSLAMKNALAAERRIASHNLEMWKESIRKDSLTGVLNRTSFRSELQTALLRDDRLYVMLMCDMDYFKQYNDRYGHMEGDKLLRDFAQIMTRNVGKEGLVCRMGGDEFAAALSFEKNAEQAAVRRIITRFWNSVDQELQQCAPDVAVSMGMTFSRGKEKDFSRLYEEADQALYDAKEQGRHRLCAFHAPAEPEA